jgi:DNA polymerase I-like protein with 3'-5' exonuclease and polymerase domains
VAKRAQRFTCPSLFTPEAVWKPPSTFPSLGGCKRIAIDVETNDPTLQELGPGVRRGGYVVGLCIGADDGRRTYLPVRHEGGGNLDEGLVWRWARSELNTFTGEVVGANLLYDLDYLAENGVTFPSVKRFLDVQNAEPLLDEHRLEYNLDALAETYLGERKQETLLREAAASYGFGTTNAAIKGNLWRLPAAYVGPYGEGDVDLPLRILALQEVELEKQGLTELFDLESRLIPLLLAMRRRGVRVDTARAGEVRERLVKERDAALHELKRLAGPAAELMAPESFVKSLEEAGLDIVRTTKTGQPSITKGWLEKNKSNSIVSAVLRGRRVDTIINTFIDGHIGRHAINGRIHCVFNQLKGDDGGTIARFCLAGDTPIMIPGGTKCIQDITIGDRVYSYDDKQQLRLGKVTWSGKTGLRQVMRLAVKGKQQIKVLLITPEHQVRLSDGSYRSVQDLCPGDRVMALSRVGGKHAKDYSSLNIFGDLGRPKAEHRTLFMIEHGYLPEHVHHADEQRNHNDIDNLEPMTISGHAKHHMTHEEASRRVRLAHSRSNSIRIGAANGLTRWSKLRNPTEKLVELTKKGYSPRQIQDMCKIGKGTVEKRLIECGMDAASWIKFRVADRATRGLTDSRILAGFSTRTADAKEALLEIRANNHRVISVEMLPGLHEVYDIEVEDYHNFIANEVCTHNSSSNPNLQNLPARDEEIGPLVRSLFIPENDEDWVRDDLSQIEYRFLAHYARGPGANEARQHYRDDPKTDYHKLCAVFMGVDPEDRYARKKTKGVNFCKIYGGGIPKIAATIGCSVEDATIFCRKYDEQLPFVNKTLKAATEAAQQKGFVTTILHRIQRFNLWEPPGNYTRQYAPLPRDRALAEYGDRIVRAFTYAALNRVLQGSAADLMKKAMVDIFEAGICNELGAPLITVHDELDWSVPRNPVARVAVDLAKRIMETCITLRVPIIAEREEGPSWGECT